MARILPAVLGAAALCCAALLVQSAAAQTADGGVEPAAFKDAVDGPAAESDEKVSLMRELMRRRGGDPAAAAQLIQLARQCSPTVAAGLFDDLATAHQRDGDLNLAAETRQLLIERFPDEPAAAAATLWLVRLYASSEVARAHRRAEATPKLGMGKLVPYEGAATDDDATPDGGEQTSQASAPGVEPPNEAAAYALFVASKATGGRPAMEQDPALVFQRSVAARLAGEEKLSRGALTSLKHAGPANPWCDAARVEAALAESPSDPPPKAAMHCTRTTAPPQLDGRLDDDCWKAGALGLGDPAAKTAVLFGPAEVRLAYDSEFLYVAVLCAKASGGEYESDDAPRTHDGADDNRDRVRLLLDLDRDYATWFELVVDSRGWTADRCWDDAAWNPEWFVAAKTDAACWTIEAAIPLAELASKAPQAGDAWACQVERRVPGVGAQAWPEALANEPTPAQFGLLLFDAGK